MNVILDNQNEQMIALSDVPKHLPRRNGKKVHYSTVYRWVTKGARGRILESKLVGGIRYTTLAALNRFFDTATTQAGQNHVDDAIERVFRAS